MWCERCQFDVPGVAVLNDPKNVVCPRCQASLVANTAAPPSSSAWNSTTLDEKLPLLDDSIFQEIAAGTHSVRRANSALLGGLNDPPQDQPSPTASGAFDEAVAREAEKLSSRKPAPQTSAEEPPRERSWEEEAIELEQLLAELDVKMRVPEAPAQPHRRDASHRRLETQGPHWNSRPEAIQAAAAASAAVPRLSWLCWMVISLGLMLVVCGGVLLGWSFLAGRQELWHVGLPLTLSGQVIVLVGFILQVESLWKHHRQTAKTVRQLHQELHRVEHTMAVASHATPSQSFYVHFAERASPHLLLADIKGQIDLLTTRIAQTGSESLVPHDH